MSIKRSVFLFTFIVFLLIFAGCGTMEHTADYSTREKVILAPLLVIEDTGSKEKYYPIKNWLYTGIVSNLADNGYSLIISSDCCPDFKITPAQIESIKSGKNMRAIAPTAFKHVLIYTIDKNEKEGIPILAETGKAAVTLYIVDNETGKLFWSEQANQDWIDTPFTLVALSSSRTVIHEFSTDPQKTAIGSLVKKLINNSPLLNKKE